MAGSVLTVSLNAAVDVSCLVDGFAVGQIHTIRALDRVAGGKANNVARVLASLGRPVIATGFAGGAAGNFIIEHLRSCGITVEFELVAGESRTCTTIVDRTAQTLTFLREQGPTLSDADVDRMLARFRHLVRRADFVVVSGSLPPGIPADFYRLLVGEAYRVSQARTILDACGQALAEALPAQPYMVKPNLEELEEWAGSPLPDDAAVLAAARRLMDAGPLVVAVSLGPRGLMLVSPEGAWRAVPPAVAAVNTVGSGDSLVAGMVAGLLDGLPAADVLRLAVACGTANALTATVGVVEQADLQRILPQVYVEHIG